jgi:hypothetical protein
MKLPIATRYAAKIFGDASRNHASRKGFNAYPKTGAQDHGYFSDSRGTSSSNPYIFAVKKFT